MKNLLSGHHDLLDHLEEYAEGDSDWFDAHFERQQARHHMHDDANDETDRDRRSKHDDW